MDSLMDSLKIVMKGYDYKGIYMIVYLCIKVYSIYSIVYIYIYSSIYMYVCMYVCICIYLPYPTLLSSSIVLLPI